MIDHNPKDEFPKCPNELRHLMEHYAVCFCHLIPIFSYPDAQKWMTTINPFLGGVRPVDMIYAGRIDKVLKFIKSRIDENDES